jgi:hypothetical protein
MIIVLLYLSIFLGLNIVFRKLAGAATPTIEFTVEDETIKMTSKVSFFNHIWLCLFLIIYRARVAI